MQRTDKDYSKIENWPTSLTAQNREYVPYKDMVGSYDLKCLRPKNVLRQTETHKGKVGEIGFSINLD